MADLITNRDQDHAQWYNDLVRKAGLAEHSEVRGCMVIKPYGYGLWEKMREVLDRMFKETGHQNAYFPLFIPKSYLSKEADHVEGFAKECAVVTHYRLKNDPKGGVMVDPAAKLEEELIVRPTSETMIWSSYKKWIQSYRDLPLLINQWANVVRWEMRTRLFLRTAEFLWQEGHTAHASKAEAIKEAELMLDVYADFAENWMAMPVLKGIKTESERFAGADETYCIESLTQEGKAIQAGTSHFLGQNFAKAFDVKFANKAGSEDYVWATSWGVSTRLVGALLMTHSDDDGLILPPKIAPIQVVIIPFLQKKKVAQNKHLLNKCENIASELKKAGVRLLIDKDETKRTGFKHNEYEMKGIPVRLVLGPRDLEEGKIELVRRDSKEKQSVSLDGLCEVVVDLMEDIQGSMYKKALLFRAQNTHKAADYAEFKKLLEEKGGFILAHWDGRAETERKIQEETKASIRCIIPGQYEEEGKCIYSGNPSKQMVVFAKAY